MNDNHSEQQRSSQGSDEAHEDAFGSSGCSPPKLGVLGLPVIASGSGKTWEEAFAAMQADREGGV